MNFLVLEGENRIEVAKLLVDHESQDTHLSGTAIIEFDCALLLLPFVGLFVPAKVEGTVAEIAHEFGLEIVVSSGSRRVGSLHEEKSEAHLSNDRSWESIKGSKASRNIISAREADSCVRDEVTCYMLCIVNMLQSKFRKTKNFIQ